MARFAEGERHDPFRNFNFRIIMCDREVAACRKMSALDVTINTVKFRAGNNHSSVDEVMPGRVEYKPVTFESGVTNDNTLEEWANQLVAHEASPTPRSPDPLFRRTVEIHVLDIDGTMVKKYILHRAWPSKFTAMSDLAGDGNDVIIETLELTHEGFDRVEPTGG
jgi:phage tail-like protein